ncbi:hypothetical protein OG455_01905 [Kitasatospora sp. NBC_01287]|uniref:hypothetical protein n=1 Tax=Kitasatospora sp. NBC_01287 TaxID=2903573 RepID=UPI00225A02DE|nr:hypothetical protein [Kitasatospora sp. NBC_01287]MCX4744278.1 hypothetical protein [Kitasatospora sp. NBC_01287]
MSATGIWVLLPVPDEAVARFAPLLDPPVARQRQAARTRRLWRDWQAAPELVGGLRQVGANGRALEEASEAFQELSGACPLDAHIETVYELWGHGDQQGPLLTAGCRKGHPAAALAHGLGPARFARLPGWFGDLTIGSARVRAELPHVEAALDLTSAERRAAEERTVTWLCESGDGDAAEAAAMLDGIVPVWQAAARAGRGLSGAMVIPC